MATLYHGFDVRAHKVAHLKIDAPNFGKQECNWNDHSPCSIEICHFRSIIANEYSRSTLLLQEPKV
jgi:hypothetical protein